MPSILAHLWAPVYVPEDPWYEIHHHSVSHNNVLGDKAIIRVAHTATWVFKFAMAPGQGLVASLVGSRLVNLAKALPLPFQI